MGHVIGICVGVGLGLYLGYALLWIAGGVMSGEPWSDVVDALLFRD